MESHLHSHHYHHDSHRRHHPNVNIQSELMCYFFANH